MHTGAVSGQTSAETLEADGATAVTLLRCLRGGSGTPVPSDVDWPRLIELAREQRVVPLLYSQVSTTKSGCPPGPLAQLRSLSLGIGVKSLAMQRDLEMALTTLGTAGIPAIVLKGAHLRRRIYRHAGLREMNDLDLMVRPAEAVRASEALRSLGYEFIVPFVDRDFIAQSHHLPRLIQAGRSSIEVHVALIPPRAHLRIDTDGLWQRACALDPGSCHLTLAPEDLLLHICTHSAYGHAGEFGLRPLCDVAEIVRAVPALDWQVVCDRAVEWRAARGTFLTLHLAAECLGAKVPEQVLSTLRPPDFDEVLGRLMRTHLFTRKSLSLSVSVEATRTYGSLSLSRKVAHFRRRVFVSRGELAKQFPAAATSRFPMWPHLRRLATGVGRHARLAWGVAAGRDEALTAMIKRRNVLDLWLDAERSPDRLHG